LLLGMTMQMMTVKLPPDKATLAEVCRLLKLSPAEIDGSFGVVSIDPKQNLYAVMVEEKATQKLSRNKRATGPFSNPRIAPFGPPK
jgi:hypothetical protein